MKWVVVIACTIAGAEAAADSDDADDRNEATRLFEQGRKLKEAGELDEACKRFERSFKLEPAPGTALNVGACAERTEDWRRAWELYDTAATIFLRTSDTRARFARSRADEVLAAHRDEVEAKPEPIRTEPERPKSVARESRTGLKVLAGSAFGVAAIFGVLWVQSYSTIQDYPNGSVQDFTGRDLSVPTDCGAQPINFGDPNTNRFESACAAYDRLEWQRAGAIVSGLLGTGVLLYLLATKPPPVTVVPTVSSQSVAVTATFEW